MFKFWALAVAALSGTAIALPVGDDAGALLEPRDFCLLEVIIVDLLMLDSKADAFCTSVLDIQTSTKTVTVTSTPPTTTATATAFTTATETTTTTQTLTSVVSDLFTATEVDFATVPVTQTTDITETVSTTVTVDETDTATVTDVLSVTVTDIVPYTVTTVVTATSTDIIYDRRDLNQKRAIATPSCLAAKNDAFITEVCECLHLSTPTVTTTTSLVKPSPVVTTTKTLPVTITETDSASVTSFITADITNTNTVTSTILTTIVESSFFTDVEYSSTTLDFTAYVTVDATVIETATATSDVVVSVTTEAVVTSTHTCTTLAIEKFVIADTDQTTIAEANLYSGSDIDINTNALFGPFTNPYPSTDSWYGVTPSVSMLFTCDSEQRVFVSYKNAGAFNIVAGAVSLSIDTSSIISAPPTDDASIQIYAVVWGKGLITDTSVYDTLYEYSVNGDEFEWSNDFFGTDTWVGMKKTGAIYYLDASGNLQVLLGRESTYGTF
ncbi:hypothetical protein N7488_008517 [Penicillium malachiteum]|nr:hypothetical protein N7488_008517 [Penicillium malachiteum]